MMTCVPRRDLAYSGIAISATQSQEGEEGYHTKSWETIETHYEQDDAVGGELPRLVEDDEKKNTGRNKTEIEMEMENLREQAAQDKRIYHFQSGCGSAGMPDVE